MAVHLTPEQARALGITDKPKRVKTTGKATPTAECMANRCCTCGEQFTGETAERRHADETGHCRFESVL